MADLVKDKIINELILCKNVKLQFVSKKVDDYNNTICWFKVIGKKNMIPILTIYNTKKELNELLVKKEEEVEKLNFPFFLNEMDNFLLKIKRNYLQIDEEELKKGNLFKLNLTFKYYDFVKRSELSDTERCRLRGYYVNEATLVSAESD